MVRSIVAALILTLSACGSTQGKGVEHPPVAKKADDAPTSGKIEGDLQQINTEELTRKKMKIWGEVERIRKTKHAKLPPLTATLTGGKGDPVTEISNKTQTTLTIWFAGECSHQVKVPKDATVTTVFCPGSYNIAAMVDDNAFLPLLREGQLFKAGVHYRLDFFVKKSPQ